MEDKTLVKMQERINEINEEVYEMRNATDVDINSLIKKAINNASKARSIKYYDGLAEAYRVLGTLYCYSGESKKAIETIELAESICTQHGVKKEILANLYNAFVYYYSEVINNYKKAAKYSQKGLKLAKELNLPHLYAKLTINYGVISLDVGLFEESLSSFRTSLEYGEITGDNMIILYSLANLGDTYIKLEDYEAAKEVYLKAEEINKSFQDIMVMVDIRRGLSLIEYVNGNLDRACEYLEETIVMLYNNGINSYASELTVLLIERYLEGNKLDLAQRLVKETKEIVQESKSNSLLASYHRNLAKYYELLEDYKQAYENQKTYEYYQRELAKEREHKSINAVREESNIRKLEQLKFLSEIGKEINTLNSVSEIFDSIYEHMKNYYESYNLVLGLVEEEINYVYVNNKGVKIEPYKLDRFNKKYLATWVLENNSPIVINDVEEEYDLYVDKYEVYGDPESPKSIIIVPLKVQDEILGIMNFQTYKTNSFSMDDTEIISIIASYAAIAIKNSLQAKELRNLSVKDQLTGLYNWRYYNNTLVNILENKSKADSIALLIFDIDHFKKINDRYGHSIGNICLIEIANLAKTVFTDCEFIARIGGEEFAVLILSQSERFVVQKANYFLKNVSDMEIRIEDFTVKLTVSIGIAMGNIGDFDSADYIFKKADNALYLAKENGRARIELAND